jgi:uncharacterized protein (TIGR02266 family)
VSEREHSRIPYCVRVEFRTASSFLVAYSVNISRGGLFLETDAALELGARIELSLIVPKVGEIDLVGHAVWVRGRDSSEGPPGVGIELTDESPDLGPIVDKLVANFAGISVLILCGDRQDRTSLTRLVKSIFTTAEVMQVADSKVAITLLNADVDLAIVDVDFDVEGGLNTLRAAKLNDIAIPTVALASTKKLREHARAAQADELVSNPPPMAELQVALVRAMGRPISTSATKP